MVIGWAAIGLATPTTTYWTPMTVDIQPYGVAHVGVDNYFTVFRTADDGGGSFPTDLGLTVGLLPFRNVVAEAGVDLLESSNDPLYFNAKIGIPEAVLFDGAPCVYVGVCNAGTRKNVTDQNVFYAAIGKTLPGIGRLSAGPYVGNRRVLVNRHGDRDNTGFMVACDRSFMPVKDAAGNEFSRWVVAADYASGDNAFGGGGFGVTYFLSKDIGVLTGPVWFNDDAINGAWKWTIQLDINL